MISRPATRPRLSAASSGSVGKATARPPSARASAGTSDSFSSYKKAPVQLGRVSGPVGPPRSPNQASSEARKLFVASTGGAGTIGGTVKDYRAVTDTSFAAEAQAQLEKNRPLEAARLAQLPAADQQRYTEVQAKLKDDPTAQLAMQAMLIEGRLPGEKDLREGKTLLEQLHGLSAQKLAPGMDGGENLLAQTVKEVFIPGSIGQGDRGTCGATSALQSLARENPAEYVRLVAGLASPEGVVQLANGDTVRREPDALTEDGFGRATTQRLLGPAMMEYANFFLDYDNPSDLSGQVLPGMINQMQQHLLEGLFDRDFQSHEDYSLWSQQAGQQRLANGVLEAVDAGQEPVTVAMYWPTPDKGHLLLVDHVERTPEGTFVVLTNPWGQEERIPYDEFTTHLQGYNAPAD